ncbi:MAG: FAD:protein FMN transferase [Treponema sp.]|nr:FAD:protein FMN transferase [Treponema sp.]
MNIHSFPNNNRIPRPHRSFFTAVILLICATTMIACGRTLPPQMEFVLGTICNVNLFEFGTQKLYAAIYERIREIDQTMNVQVREGDNHLSTLMIINQNAGIAPVKIGKDLFDLLEKAKYYAEITNGAFDPTVGPLVSLWGIGTENERIPKPEEIKNALPLINWRDMILDREQGTAFLQRQGMALDLGAIAKGYAGDEAIRIAKEAQVGHAIIDLGGNIVVLGARNIPKKNLAAVPWRVGVQDPLAERGSYIGVLSVTDTSIVTSGVYERFFMVDGKRYHHILSTTDGYPVDNGLLSVTIVTHNSTDADGLSTSVFTLGFEKGLALLKTLPNTEAIFIFTDHSVYVTDGLRDIFQLTNSEYRIIGIRDQGSGNEERA